MFEFPALSGLCSYWLPTSIFTLEMATLLFTKATITLSSVESVMSEAESTRSENLQGKADHSRI